MRGTPRRLIKATAALALLAAILILGVFWAGGRHLRRRYSVSPDPVVVPRDADAAQRGRHIALIRGCITCHGDDLGGALVIRDGAMGLVYGPNLTAGAGGVGARLQVIDWVRAVRHGIAPDGHPLYLMPSEDYARMSDQDLGDIIAYASGVPPVARSVPPIRVGPVARVLLAFGQMRLAAEQIDQQRTGSIAAVAAAVSPAYGRYLAQTCSGCHNPSFSGGKIAGGPPDWPPAANLTPAGDLKGWRESDFRRALRTGRRPDGTEISEVMPRVFAQMTDRELTALWMFLRGLPPSEVGKPAQGG